ncbi:MAG: hypothetical protein KDC34_18815 [Saprospiraceae bacterium]|nr:hypothetical protein [Saprospiraceae bacterium]
MHQLKNILLFLAAGIQLLHALVPHRHQETMTAVEHQALHEQADDLIDYIGLAFHQLVSDQVVLFNSDFSEQFKELRSSSDIYPANLWAASDYRLSKQSQKPFGTPFQTAIITPGLLINGLRAPPGAGFSF